MRTLKYALLGLINKQPCTGYDISKEFKTTISCFWNASHSQIYPELAKLVEEGLITYNIEISGDVLEKKVYSITEKGRTEFLSWLERCDKLKPSPKDVFRLRLYFLQDMPRDKSMNLLQDQLNQHIARLNELNRDLLKFDEEPSHDSYSLGDYLILQGAIMREETYIKWLNLCFEKIKY